MSIYQLTFCFTHKLKRRHPCRLWWGFLRKCWLCTSSKVKSLRWHDEWCVNTKWSAGPNYLHNLKNCRVNPRLQSKPVSLFSLKILTKFVNVKSSMIYMTKMQIRVRKIFRNYLVNNSLHEKGSNPKNSFSTWYDQIYCLKANHQNYDISLKLTKHFIKKYSS